MSASDDRRRVRRIDDALLPSAACPYFKDRRMRLSATIAIGVDGNEFDRFMAKGYRRTGLMLYRPRCLDGCRDCVPIRVPLADFRPSRSQRRLLTRVSTQLAVSIRRPTVCAEHVQLHNRHAKWVTEDNPTCTPDQYRASFVESCATTILLEYRVENELAGLSTLDIGNTTVSSVYFCWEPRFAKLSLGTVSALWEMAWGQAQGKNTTIWGTGSLTALRCPTKTAFGPTNSTTGKASVGNLGPNRDACAATAPRQLLRRN